MCDLNHDFKDIQIILKKFNLLRAKSNGVVIIPEKRYSYPKGHPCHGCVYTFESSRPSCIFAGEAGNCSFQRFYRKLKEKRNLNEGS